MARISTVEGPGRSRRKQGRSSPVHPVVSNTSRDTRPLPDAGQTDAEPASADERREHPTTGVASHGSSSPRRI
jgi:hypothetical protein